jgi:hypothetical protein
MSLTTSPRTGKVASLATSHNYPTGIALSDSLAHVAEFEDQRLTIVDITDPLNPLLRSRLPLGNRITGIAVSGRNVYLTGIDAQLQIVDVTDPSAPKLTTSLLGPSYSIAAQDTTVYVVSYGVGGVASLRIFDAANASAPVLLSQTAIGSGFSEIAVIGTIVYICTENSSGGGNWLRLYDVSNPSAPLPLGAVSLGTATFRCMSTDGSHAFIGVGDNPTSSRLLIYDVSNPAAAPIPKGSLRVNDIPSRVAIADDLLYINFWVFSNNPFAESLILATIDISDLDAPALLDYTTLGSGDGVEMAVLGDLLLIPGLNFDVYARPADQATGTLRVAGGMMVDSAGVSNGGLINGVTFGIVSGEGISSRRRVPGDNPFGIDFYTAFFNRMAITNGGRVGIGLVNPQQLLHVNGAVAGVGAYLDLSDERLKEHVASIADPIEKVEQLRGVTFNWKQDAHPEWTLPQGRQIGLLAQEVEAVFPEAVTTDDDGTKSVAYSKLIPVLIEAIKAQQAQIEDLKGAVTTQRGGADARDPIEGV